MQGDNSRYDLVVIGASAGGVMALIEVLGSLPADFPLPIAVVQHRSARIPNLLPEILGRRSKLHVKIAQTGDRMQGGTVYLAPPDFHLEVIHNGTFQLSDGRKIRHVRSSANPLFASAAHSLGGRVIAVVLTGSGRDATDGVQSIRAAGGTVIAQDASTSERFEMPKSAIETGCVDRVLPLGEIPRALSELAKGKRVTATGD